MQRDKIEQISRDKHETIQRDHVEDITRDHHPTISGKEAIAITGSHSLAVTGDVIEQFSGNQSTQVTGSCYIKGMNVVVEAMTGLTINSAGIQITGIRVMINSGGAALPGTVGNLVSPISLVSAAVADDAKAGDKGAFSKSGQSDGAGSSNGSSSGSSSSDAPWHDPNSLENKEKKSWIEIELLDQDKKPVAGEPYRITLTDGETAAEGTLDDKGRVRVDGIDPGTCKVTFPNRDRASWSPK